MDTPEKPQIYLLTPPMIDLAVFPDRLASLLDSHEIACVRLDLATRNEEELSRAADALRETCHARDVALVISAHTLLATNLGLDGVHLPDATQSVRDARKALGEDAIIGSFCGTSRHDGLNASEAGADYVSFGPVVATTLGTGEQVDHELFQWWSEVIEVPCVAEGNLTEEAIANLWKYTDFFGIGDEIWVAEDAALALTKLKTAMA